MKQAEQDTGDIISKNWLGLIRALFFNKSFKILLTNAIKYGIIYLGIGV